MDREFHYGHPMCPYEQACVAKILRLSCLASHQQVASRLLCEVDRCGALHRHLKRLQLKSIKIWMYSCYFVRVALTKDILIEGHIVAIVCGITDSRLKMPTYSFARPHSRILTHGHSPCTLFLGYDSPTISRG